ANKDKPFFLFFASHALHVPRMPHERFQGKTQLGFRGDAIVELDWGVGELMKTLDRLKLAENTLVVFCSDNGPVMDDGYKDGALEKLGDHRASGPYSGGKYSVYEGGTRTPFITRWKGKIQPGVSDQVVCTIDLAASFASLTNTKLPAEACLDSMNVMPALLGNAKAKGRESLIQQDNGNAGNYGFLVGDWKLQRHDKKRTRNLKVAKQLENTPVPKFQLYDLSKDPAEKNNIIEQHPDVAERLKKQLATLIKSSRSR
ncbi:MAG: sulfatase-like hydrolase/transferase, partial [Verrucomicrobia bacterium]|nr:sulfatase-like hydrolase/transferase [Verrucomicrobiota bacterium]